MQCEKWPYHFYGPQWPTEGRHGTCGSLVTGTVQALLLQSSHSPYMHSFCGITCDGLGQASPNWMYQWCTSAAAFWQKAQSFMLFLYACFLVCRYWMHSSVSVCSAKNFKWRLFIKCNPAPPTPPIFHSFLLLLFLCFFFFFFLLLILKIQQPPLLISAACIFPGVCWWIFLPLHVSHCRFQNVDYFLSSLLKKHKT